MSDVSEPEVQSDSSEDGFSAASGPDLGPTQEQAQQGGVHNNTATTMSPQNPSSVQTDTSTDLGNILAAIRNQPHCGIVLDDGSAPPTVHTRTQPSMMEPQHTSSGHDSVPKMRNIQGAENSYWATVYKQVQILQQRRSILGQQRSWFRGFDTCTGLFPFKNCVEATGQHVCQFVFACMSAYVVP